MKKRISGIIHSLSPGGAEKNFVALFNALSKKDYECSIICLTRPLNHQLEISPEIETVVLKPCSKFNVLSIIKNLKNVLLEIQPDCVISFMDQTNILTLLALHQNKEIPVIVCERNNPARNLIVNRRLPKLLQSMARLLRNKIYKRARSICTQTIGASEYFKINCPSVPTASIANYIEPVNFLDGAERQKIILSVARLVPEKGLANLIKVFARLSKRYPEWQLMIYGEGPERTNLNNLINDLGITASAKLMGQTSDLSAIYRAAPIFVLNSEFEGFPNALLEAMVNGCSVVARDCDFGPNEIISDGVDGFLVKGGSSDELFIILEKLILMPELQELSGQNALKIAQKFTLERFIAEFGCLVKSCCKASSTN